jgi:hypothetical protein
MNVRPNTPCAPECGQVRMTSPSITQNHKDQELLMRDNRVVTNAVVKPRSVLSWKSCLLRVGLGV